MKTIYKTVIGVIVMTIVGITAVACSSTKKGYTDVPDTATAAAEEELKWPKAPIAASIEQR